MMEIVFSDSAAGSLKCARGYGRGEYPGEAVSVIIHHEDGREATPEEIEQARAEVEEQQRKKWEAAVPVDFEPGDVFGFHLALSVGRLDGDFWQGRREALGQLFSCYPESDREDVMEELIAGGKAGIEKFLERAKTGEALRVWYSKEPDDLCGLCWLMAELEKVGWKGELFLVKLPDLVERKDGCLVRYAGWGEVEPGEWGSFLSLQEKAPALLPRFFAEKWKQLREESAPLRAVISGEICGVGEDFYDTFLLRTLEPLGGEFHEAALIGQVLGKYRLGFGDGWLALRVEKLIQKGLLEPVTEPPAGGPCYHRMLRKR